MDIASNQPGPATAAKESVITLGGGCFWCTGAAISRKLLIYKDLLKNSTMFW